MNTKASNKSLLYRTAAVFMIVMLMLAGMPVMPVFATPILPPQAVPVVEAAIALRGVVTTATTATTNLTINKPVGVVAGDVMIVNIAKVGNNTNAPTLVGWTLIDGRSLAGTTLRYGAVLYRVVDGTEGASFTFALGAGTTGSVGSIVAFSGVDAVTPFDVASGLISVQASQTAVAATTKTTVTTNTVVVMFGQAAASAPTWSGWTTTSPGALTELYDNQLAGNASVGAAWATKPTAGATGAGVATLSAAERNGGILIALRAAAVATAPTVTTQPVTAITATTATGNGNITALGSPNPTQYGVVWDTAINPTVALATKTAQGPIAVTGAFTSAITGLTPNTLYHVRAYATNTAGTSYGADVTFTTLPPVAPTVTTQAVTAITAATATGNGNITALGSPNPTQYGVVWDIAINPTVALATKTAQGAIAVTGAFTSSITGLAPNTLYHVRAYATNTAGTSYGADVTFTTLPPVAPTVTTQAVTAIAANTATGNGNITALGVPNPTQYGIVWNTATNPTVALATKTTQGVPAGVGAFTSAITGLTPGTLYYVRAYATNTAGTSYGANVTFTTSLTALTITASAGAGGTITPSGAVPVAGGANQAFDITPNPTFILSDVLVDGVSVGRANSYTFNAVNANHTIAASFNGGWSAPTGSTNVVVITNPNNVFTSNNTYTRYWGLGEGADYINFNIPAIPAGSTINGIEVAVEGNSVGGMNMQVQLSGNNGTTFTAVTPARITNLLAADSTVILGGAGDTWGKAWSNTEFTNANFRVRMLSAPPATNRKDIDQLQVKVTYTLPVTAPTVTTNPATGVTTTGATLNGTVNANNSSTTVTFQYGLTNAYGSTVTATQSPVIGNTNTAVSAAITGLTPNTLYHYRVVGVNTGGTTNGLDGTFTTASLVPPTVTTNPATGVATTGTTLNGTVNANNFSTTVTFEYGLTNAYGSTVTATQSPVTGNTNTAVSAAITGLTPNTLYHYRVVGVSAGGTTNGGDLTFTTSLAAPTVTTNAATLVTMTGATLNGTVNANNSSTTVTFEYGLTNAYGTTVTATQSPVTGTSNTAVSFVLTGLTTNTTYHYRVVGVNTGGTTNGGDQTFTTNATGPTVVTDAATGMTSIGATLNGTVNANNASTAVTFEYGLTNAYGTIVTATQSPVTGTTNTAVSFVLTGLTPNTTYHYRVVGVNGGGTANGLDSTFKTIQGPSVINPNGVSTSAGFINFDYEVMTSDITQFSITFSKDVNNSGGGSGADDVTNPANYLLVRDLGDTADFQTVSCNPGAVVPADTKIDVTGVVYDSGTHIATFTVNGGLPLSNGNYRLYICGTTSITDLFGVELAGDGTTAGTDFIRNFIVSISGGGGGNRNGSRGNKSDAKTIGNLLIPVTGFTPNQVTLLPIQPAGKAYKPLDEIRIEIPTLGIDFPIVGVSLSKNKWDLTWLNGKVGYLEGSAYPTFSGNTVLTAHVIDANNNLGPFSDIKGMQSGDKIYLHAYGQVYVYQVQENSKLLPTSISTVFKHEEYDWVTLVTCEDYNVKAKTYNYRRMVRAVLVSVIPEK
jgi:LPXTG-site transpeptidase (sortase) family protein